MNDREDIVLAVVALVFTAVCVALMLRSLWLL